MKTTSIVTIIGDIDPAGVERKVVREKKLAEFRVADLAIRISAWEQRAEQVPDSGRVVVQGYLASRTYQVGGQDRTTTEMRATQITAIDHVESLDSEPF